MEVKQIPLIVRAVRLIAVHPLVSFVYNNRMPTCAQLKPLTWVILLVIVILMVIGVTANQQQENIRYHVAVNVL